jgi:hypothetical protein
MYYMCVPRELMHTTSEEVRLLLPWDEYVCGDERSHAQHVDVHLCVCVCEGGGWGI